MFLRKNISSASQRIRALDIIHVISSRPVWLLVTKILYKTHFYSESTLSSNLLYALVISYNSWLKECILSTAVRVVMCHLSVLLLLNFFILDYFLFNGSCKFCV